MNTDIDGLAAPLLQRERERWKESGAHTEVGEACMFLNTDIRRSDNFYYKEREGGKERARQTDGGEACMKLNTGLERQTNRPTERKSIDGDVHKHRHRRSVCISVTKRERGGKERARHTEVGEACIILNTDIRRSD